VGTVGKVWHRFQTFPLPRNPTTLRLARKAPGCAAPLPPPFTITPEPESMRASNAPGHVAKQRIVKDVTPMPLRLAKRLTLLLALATLPTAASAAHAMRGLAAYYGEGHATASGERFNKRALTAAHRTLPFGTLVRVTRTDTGRSVVVRINDRGPFVANRIVDLSYTAAAKLDMLGDGTTFVELRVLSPGSPATESALVAAVPAAESASAPAAAAAPTARQTWAQVGAFADASNLERVLQRLQAAGLSAVTSGSRVNGLNVTRVRIGPVVSVTVFDALQERLRSVGLGDAIIVTD
jgi:rare lipoprotein A